MNATRTENIRQIREMLKRVKPDDLSGDELATMVEIWCDPASARGVRLEKAELICNLFCLTSLTRNCLSD